MVNTEIKHYRSKIYKYPSKQRHASQVAQKFYTVSKIIGQCIEHIAQSSENWYKL